MARIAAAALAAVVLLLGALCSGAVAQACYPNQTSTALGGCQWQAGPPELELEQQWDFRCEASSIAVPTCWTIGFGSSVPGKFCCLGLQPDGVSCRRPDDEACTAKGQCASDSCSTDGVCCPTACDDDVCSSGRCLLRNSKQCTDLAQCGSGFCSDDGFCCNKNCGSDSTCQSGVCLLLLGNSCPNSASCASGFCSDDRYCCGSACSNATLTTCVTGTCKRKLQMPCTNPDGSECLSGYCSADGFCCQSDCGAQGTCASGTCKLFNTASCDVGSQCDSGHCSFDHRCCATACPSDTDSCATGTCLSGLGRTCVADGECSSGFCSGDGYCCTSTCDQANTTCANSQGSCLRVKGATCSAGAECSTGFCSADGFCCDSACANATTSTCSTGRCLVRNSRRCTYDDNCASGFCSGDGFCCASQCDSDSDTCVQGVCLTKTGEVCAADADCNSAMCSGDGFCCSSACANSNTSTCASGQCRLRPGEPCTLDNQCWSDFCSADGFCCTTACLGADGVNSTCASGSCCGDKLLSPLPNGTSEQCDDGNLNPDDGCTNTCDVTDGYLCIYNSTLSPEAYQNRSFCFACPLDQRGDEDKDGFPDCIDECPSNGNLAFPAACACDDCSSSRSGGGASKTTNSLLIALPVAISALALLLCLLCCLLLVCVIVGCLLRRRHNKWDPYIDDVVVFWDEPLGRGAYGSVFYAQLHGGARVAAKRVHRDELPDIEREARNLAQIENPNVVKVYGLYRAKRLGASGSGSDGDNSSEAGSDRPLPINIAPDDETGTATYIILEPVGDGVTLQQVAPHLSLAEVIEVLQGVAAGMAALYAARLLHRDLSARNVLCERVTTRSGSMQHRVKIADFGHTIQMPRGRDEVQESATAIAMAWTAPEGFQGRWRLASDVWSFGVLMWEMANHGADPTAVPPYSSAERGDIYRHLEQRGSPLAIEGSSEAQRRLHSLLRECLELDPDARPTWDSISASLEATRVAVADTDRRKPHAVSAGPASIVAQPLGAVDLSQMANPTSHAYDQG